MDDLIRNSIELRRESITNYFTVPAGIQQEVDDVFAGMEALGEACADVAEFETKLQSHPVNQRYMALFANLKPGAGAVADAMKQSLRMKGKKEIAKDIGGMVASEVKQAVVQPLRHEAYEQRREYLRDNVPGYAAAQDAVNTAHTGRKLFGFLNRKKLREEAEAEAAALREQIEAETAAQKAEAEAEIRRLQEKAAKAREGFAGGTSASGDPSEGDTE